MRVAAGVYTAESLRSWTSSGTQYQHTRNQAACSAALRDNAGVRSDSSRPDVTPKTRRRVSQQQSRGAVPRYRIARQAAVHTPQARDTDRGDPFGRSVQSAAGIAIAVVLEALNGSRHEPLPRRHARRMLGRWATPGR
jgi:hypothetical protein